MRKLFIILLSALSLTAFAQEKKVAVYVMGEDAGINKVLGSKLVTAIARSEEYSAVERTIAFLSELNKEQTYQRTGAVDDDEISRLGKQFGVQYVCVAVVSEAFNEKYLSARLIDVESAQVERSASSSKTIQSLDDIVNAANTVSSELLSSLKKGRSANSPKVAVYVVKNEEGKNIGRVLGDKLVAGFTNSGRYIAIERTNSFLSQLNKEQKYQRTGAVDDSDISRLGKQFGVQYVCVADISDVFGEKYVSARLIDVETAEVINSHDVGGKLDNMSSCLNLANEIATNLSKGSFKEQAEEAKRKAKEEALKQTIENKKYELQKVLRNRYCVVEVDNQKWMVCIEPLTDVTRGTFHQKNYYSRCGYSNWHIGDYSDYAHKLDLIASEIYHYLGVSIPIFENGRYFIAQDSEKNNKKDCSVMYCGPTHINQTNYTYLDKPGKYRIMDVGYFNFLKKGQKVDAILVRKVNY